jgi:hypothetical protein
VPVIAAFSRPSDLVAVPGAGCAALAAAAARTGRRVLGIAASPGSTSCAAGQAALAVTVFSGALPGGGTAAGEPVLYAACQRALRPGGILAIIAGRPAPRQIPDLSHAVASARAAGLVYAQHIVLLHAAVDGGQLRPFPGQHAACPGDGPPGTRVHADLLVLTKPGGPDDR